MDGALESFLVGEDLSKVTLIPTPFYHIYGILIQTVTEALPHKGLQIPSSLQIIVLNSFNVCGCRDYFL